jgi:phosphatidylserine/phosphatidylglycerophosphate/cardiolipin synthase-like enzyme
VFKELVPKPAPDQYHSSFEHPIQSFVWDDFTAKSGYEYDYFFYPTKGKPKNLEHSKKPIRIRVRMEEERDSGSQHDVFFNRGVASSQAYANRFDNQRPDKIKDPDLRQKAWKWLGRHLDDAIIDFIAQAEEGDSLYACLYEFHYPPVVEAFAKAIADKVNVKIIYDAKDTDTSPRKANEKAMKGKIATENRIKRTANKSYIQHNKFILLLKGEKQTPTAVWTGSTNISENGIFGQSNVGHWIRNKTVARKYLKYWKLLEKDPGNRDDRTSAEGRASNKEYKQKITKIQPDVVAAAPDTIKNGMTCIFSPRPTADMLSSYAGWLDNVTKVGCITLAFGISSVIKDLLKDNTVRNPITFMLLEQEDKPNKKSKSTFVKLGAKNNVYQAFGAFIDDAVYQFVKETTTKNLGLGTWISYIHTKYMLLDPFSKKPVVVTGSANFSEPSTTKNDENMVIIKGNRRVADIYFTEFMRLFTHYFFRSIYEIKKRKKATEDTMAGASNSVFLATDKSWLDKYAAGTFRWKKIEMYAAREKAKTL